MPWPEGKPFHLRGVSHTYRWQENVVWHSLAILCDLESAFVVYADEVPGSHCGVAKYFANVVRVQIDCSESYTEGSVHNSPFCDMDVGSQANKLISTKQALAQDNERLGGLFDTDRLQYRCVGLPDGKAQG